MFFLICQCLLKCRNQLSLSFYYYIDIYIDIDIDYAVSAKELGQKTNILPIETSKLVSESYHDYHPKNKFPLTHHIPTFPSHSHLPDSIPTNQ